MRYIKKLAAALAAITIVMAVAPTQPAVAQAQEEVSIVYFPYGNGATYSCTGDASFVFDSAGMGNCSVEQIGALAAGLLCEVPTTLTFVHQGHQWVADASLCR